MRHSVERFLALGFLLFISVSGCHSLHMNGFSDLICLYNSADASISAICALFVFTMLFLTCPYRCSCNSGFLPTLEPGVPIIYMCRRVHTATSSVSLHDRSQAGLTDGSNVHYFPIIHQAHFFSNLFRVPYSEFAL
jgi:hypothetical protein